MKDIVGGLILVVAIGAGVFAGLKLYDWLGSAGAATPPVDDGSTTT